MRSANSKASLPGRPLGFPGGQIVNAVLAIGIVGCGIWAIVATMPRLPTGCSRPIALVLGVLAVIPIGGADMPVVISLLNSLSGVAASMAGFVIGNQALIIGGALVGAAGFILTMQMGEAMNRSLANVLFAGFGTEGAAPIDDRRQAGQRGNAGRRGDRARLRRHVHGGARLRPGRRPGPARGAGARRPRSRSAASRSTTRSTRWPAACPAT